MRDGAVRPLGDERRHYWLALSMAGAAGADLQAALNGGRIDHSDWAGVVQRCRGCGWTEGCACWLAARGGADDAPVPRACPNAPVFDTVLAGQDQAGGSSDSA